MGFVFDPNSVQKLDDWYQTEAGRNMLRLQKDLIQRLLRPRPGMRILDVGCGSGVNLQAFKREGLFAAGIDPSPAALKLAEKRMGSRQGLHQGRAEDLPFEDNEFDIVTLINCLGFVDDPEAAVAEAFRTARQQIFIGVLNGLSLACLSWRVKDLFSESPIKGMSRFSLWDLTAMVRRVTGGAPVRWASTGMLPPALSERAAAFEAQPMVQRIPFGIFLGLNIDVVYKYRADPLILDGASMKLKTKTAGSGATGCGMKAAPPDPVLRPKGRQTEGEANHGAF